jgi:putative transposase
MPDFRRYCVAGGTYFFTVVTARRAPWFADEAACRLLGDAMRDCRARLPFETIASVLLPDHLHAIWTLPGGDADYATRWRTIKATFTTEWIRRSGSEQEISSGYERQRRRGIWQARFIEHLIRDEHDLHAHADYLHYNPVKHGYARCPKDWPWSTFNRFVESGDYPENWGCSDDPPPDLSRVNASLLE